MGKVINQNHHVFNYGDGVIFTLPDDGSKSYQNNHYKKLMAGELDRLILNKRPKVHKLGDFLLNYRLESEGRTKLKDLYVEKESS